MREIFFDEKLGEARRNLEGCEPHGQRWIFGGETRRDWETLGETGSESGNGRLEVGKERVVMRIF